MINKVFFILSSIVSLYDNYERLEYNSHNSDNIWFDRIEKFLFERRTKRLRKMGSKQVSELKDIISWTKSNNGFYINRCKNVLESIDQVIELVEEIES